MGPLKETYRKYIGENVVYVLGGFFCLGFSDFSLYGSWEAGNVCKSYVRGLGTFLDIGKLIMITFNFDDFLTTLRRLCDDFVTTLRRLCDYFIGVRGFPNGICHPCARWGRDPRDVQNYSRHVAAEIRAEIWAEI